MTETTIVEQKDNIATIILNRPKALNSLNITLVDELANILHRLRDDNSIRCIVITGNGPAFCAGGDLEYLSKLKDATLSRKFIRDAGGIASTIVDIEKPVIAMVNGVAAGAGFNLALACDFIFASRSAKFGQGFVKVGLVPDCGGTFFLSRHIGLNRAKELLFTADFIDAEAACRLGLVNRVTEDFELKDVVQKFALKLANNAPIALGFTKKLVNRNYCVNLDTCLEFEADVQSYCMLTEEHQEGIAAFREKRQPKFNEIKSLSDSPILNLLHKSYF
ncbi:MAG: enoyl-CoA hydratase/isomerase family protein [Negativicutes bacterium]|nr:enoyl-CoA hydratase/isomerase family protein [Negativicutes bacterium]